MGGFDEAAALAEAIAAALLAAGCTDSDLQGLPGLVGRLGAGMGQRKGWLCAQVKEADWRVAESRIKQSGVQCDRRGGLE